MDPYCHGFCQQVRHVAGVTIVRTAFEDRVLQEELEGVRTLCKTGTPPLAALHLVTSVPDPVTF